MHDQQYRQLQTYLAEQFGRLAEKTDDIDRALRTILRKEHQQMTLSQEILDAIAAETTVIDSFIALVEGLVRDSTISPEAAAAIKAELLSNKDKVAAAIVANTPPTPPVEPAPPVEPPAEPPASGVRRSV